MMRARVTIGYAATQSPAGVLVLTVQTRLVTSSFRLFNPLLSPSKLVATTFLKLALERDPESGAPSRLWHGLCGGSPSALVVPRHAAALIKVFAVNLGGSCEVDTVRD